MAAPRPNAAGGNVFQCADLVDRGVLFALFRAFDILKPPPIHQSQRLPGGWGVTVDDVLAAVCVALLSVLLIS